MPLVGFLPATDERIVSTVEAIRRELTVDGLVLRYRPQADGEVDGLPAGEGVFLPCSFWLADVLALQGQARRGPRSCSSGSSTCATTSASSRRSTTRSPAASSATSRRRSRTSRSSTRRSQPFIACSCRSRLSRRCVDTTRSSHLYDTSFLRHRELPLLKLFRRRVIYIFCGSDDRPTYLDGGLMERDASIDACIASVRAKKRMLRRIERYADVVITNPSHGLLHERPFVSFPIVGIPRVVAAEPAPPRPSGRLKIIHAPSHPVAKGTAIVRATLDRLRQIGYDFDYEIVQGVSNQELRERLRTCDFVVDQVWGDTPMDGLVADAALFGKPAVIGGYGWEEFRRLLRDDTLPPSERCDPEELERAIVRLLTDADHRRSLGAEARRFVVERWQAATVAQRLIDLLEGSAPAEWMHDPAELRYVLGWGQPAERSRGLIRAVVDRGGTAALGLSDKPEAEQAVLAQAAVQPVAAPAYPARAA